MSSQFRVATIQDQDGLVTAEGEQARGDGVRRWGGVKSGTVNTVAMEPVCLDCRRVLR